MQEKKWIWTTHRCHSIRFARLLLQQFLAPRIGREFAVRPTGLLGRGGVLVLGRPVGHRGQLVDLRRALQNQPEERVQPADRGVVRVRLGVLPVRSLGLFGQEGIQVDRLRNAGLRASLAKVHLSFAEHDLHGFALHHPRYRYWKVRKPLKVTYNTLFSGTK